MAEVPLPGTLAAPIRARHDLDDRYGDYSEVTVLIDSAARAGVRGSRIPWRNLALVVALACALVAPMTWPAHERRSRHRV